LPVIAGKTKTVPHGVDQLRAPEEMAADLDA